MKLRIKGSTLRLRLSETEVNKLAKGYTVQETVYFGKENTFHYALASGESDSLTANYEKGAIKVLVPEDRLKEWCKNEDDIGFERFINHAEGTSLYIQVQKDYKIPKNSTNKEPKAEF